jgi:hypothetical protein
MKPDVEKAVQEIREGLPGHSARVLEDGDGGAFVIVDGIDPGKSFSPATTWVGFHITWPYPDADVYPHFVDPELHYSGAVAPIQHPDGNLPTAMGRGAVMPGFNIPAIQISRRSNHRNARTDSALRKLIRVIVFLQSR